MTRVDRAIALGWILLCTPSVLYALAVAVAVGQPTDDPAVLLARTCVSERSWAVASHDHRAIGEVVAARVARVYAHRPRAAAWRSALRGLSPRLHGEGPIARPWLRELDARAERPSAGWRGRWVGLRREQWIATLDEARAIYAGTAPPVCERPPVAWGSEADIRARRIADLDNVTKVILDGLEGVMWANDRTVRDARAELVAVCDPQPRVVVFVAIIDPPTGWAKKGRTV